MCDSITISVVSFTALQQTVFSSIPTEELNVPDSFAPTFNCCTQDCNSYFPDDCPEQDQAFGRRPWFVDLFDLNGNTWAIFMAAGPAALAFILAFLDNGITWHIVNHPSNCIQHGDAYNYDTCISAIMVAVNSILGLPWLVASTVPCIMHVSAMSDKTKEGVTLSLQESRLTGLFTHILVLGTCFALSVIRLVPLPVLYGVFLFMGLVALPAQQFWQRILLFFQEPSEMAKTPYTQYLQLSRIHIFTAVQLAFFIMLYVVKNVKAIAIAFPVMILLCIPARVYLLPQIFTDDELTLLDGQPEAIEAWVVRKRAEIEGALKVDDIGDVTTTNELDKLVEEEEEGDIVASDDVDDNVEVVVPQREKQNSTSSQARARREKQASVTSVSSQRRRERQISTSSIDAFFETAYGVPRPRREKQPSVDRSVGGFMERQGLQMPDVVIDESENMDDAKSEISANL